MKEITKEQLIERTMSVLDKDVERIKNRIRTHLQNSGALPDTSDDNYLLSYAIAAAAYKQLYNDIFSAANENINKKVKKESNNIFNFI